MGPRLATRLPSALAGTARVTNTAIAHNSGEAILPRSGRRVPGVPSHERGPRTPSAQKPPTRLPRSLSIRANGRLFQGSGYHAGDINDAPYGAVDAVGLPCARMAAERMESRVNGMKKAPGPSVRLGHGVANVSIENASHTVLADPSVPRKSRRLHTRADLTRRRRRRRSLPHQRSGRRRRK